MALTVMLARNESAVSNIQDNRRQPKAFSTFQRFLRIRRRLVLFLFAYEGK